MITNFDWGLINQHPWFKDVLINEIFRYNIYQRFFKVEPNDVVVDIGASIGPFSWAISKQKPSQIYCLEPHKELYKTLVKNLSHSNAICINKAIGSVDGLENQYGLFNELLINTCDDSNLQIVESIKFNSFIKEYNISNIDFLKLDCEGGEYNVFNEENFNWITSNIRKIVGEWHLSNDNLKNKFREFRDLYLNYFTKYSIHSTDFVNINDALHTDWFVEYYDTITIYIDNR